MSKFKVGDQVLYRTTWTDKDRVIIEATQIDSRYDYRVRNIRIDQIGMVYEDELEALPAPLSDSELDEMTDTVEKLTNELREARKQIAELEGKFARIEADAKSIVFEINRS